MYMLVGRLSAWKVSFLLGKYRIQIINHVISE